MSGGGGVLRDLWIPELTNTQRDRATRYVAANATDPDDCALLLTMLGLLP